MDLTVDFGPPVNSPMAHHGAHPYSTTPQSTTSTASYASHFRSPLDPAAASQSPGASSYHPADTARPPQPSASPAQQQQHQHQQPENHAPTDRSLPARDFADDDAFEDAYVAFVLYCNPSFPLSVDATELRRNFSSPPKSDGKLFSVTTLFDLLKKLDAKLIKTWTDLALELGVEKPVAGQSSQKVQQYSVRLKRWLRASHIDAFFDYMIGKTPNYLRDIPPLNDPYPETRDNVCRDDDLALRALKPEFRPKRGRRRADEQDDQEPLSAIEPKRPHLDTPFSAHPQSAYPSSAVPMSAHPDDMDFSRDPWAITPASAARASSGANYRFHGGETPMTPNPLSAVTPLSAHPDSAFDESPAAMTQSQKMRMRRRHGTAVSSAWPSNSTTPNGKLRGRPPTNRSVKDGPFVTFPANPRAREGPAIDLNRNSISTGEQQLRQQTTPPPAGQTGSPNSPFRVPQLLAGVASAAASMPTPVSASSATSKSGIGAFPSGRPERLSLQVPQHIGNPVRLVTPTVVVNGADQQGQQQQQQQGPQQGPTPSSAHHPYSRDFSLGRPPPMQSASSTPSSALPPHHHQSFQHHQYAPQHHPYQQQQQQPPPPPPPSFPGFTPWTAEELRRALAADLLRADVSGRAKGLRGTEARALADALLAALHPRATATGQPGSADEVARMACAAWLGLAGGNGAGGGAAAAAPAVKRVRVRRLRERGDGYESPIDEDEPEGGDDGGNGTPMAGEDDAAAGGGGGGVRRVFDVEWELGMGAVAGRFQTKGLVVGEPSSTSAQQPAPPPRGGAGDAGGETPGGGGGDEEGGPELRLRRHVERLEERLRAREAELKELRDQVLEVALRT